MQEREEGEDGRAHKRGGRCLCKKGMHYDGMAKEKREREGREEREKSGEINFFSGERERKGREM